MNRSSRQPSATTKLVEELLAFGKDDAAPAPSSSLDREAEDVAANRNKAHSSSREPVASTGRIADGNDDGAAARLSKLSLEDRDASAPQPKPAKPAKSLKNLLRSTSHTIRLQDADGTERKRVLTSWKMPDYAYKRDPCPFPTRARGLFTERVKGNDNGEEDEYRIVARGYDKFFNVGEVSWTQWDTIGQHSTGPYELTTKSNGCIILIGALDEKNLVVTSKHSIGRNANLSTENGVSHSERGEHWLERHLESVGRKKEDLAAELFRRNLTAVAELCDDSFEEHVLAYSSELTGLHLHGLNVNEATLNTLPSSEVTQFAKDWGLIPTPYSVFPSVVAVRTYCETVQQAGGVEGPDGKITPVEGFVVRGHRRGGQAGEAFFWKVKYDEPYLMYREWREITRRLLSAYPDLDSATPKLRNEESRLYLWWVSREIKRDHAKFDPWKHGKGIIATREEFLTWSKTPEADKARRELGQKVEMDETERKNRRFDRTILVPVAVQGCGKTALGLELSKLFGWGHVQSDDFLQKKPAPHFLKAIRTMLDKESVVIADKNNHVAKHRADLVSLAESLYPKHTVRLVALVWPTNSESLSRDKFHALCASRIVDRGQNHQTLRAGGEHEQIIWKFLGQHEPFDGEVNAADSKFDHVIEMHAEWSQEEALQQCVDALAKIDGLLPPATEVPLPDERVAEAVAYAKSWTPSVREETPAPSQPKPRQKTAQARYYGISVDVDLEALVDKALPASEKQDPTSLWSALVKSSRVERHPHVTLVHRNELEGPDETVRAQKQAQWYHYAHLVEEAVKGDGQETALNVEVTLGPRLAWDGRAMSIEVSALRAKTEASIALAEDSGAHITIGTRASNIRPFEGRWLMEAVMNGKKTTAAGGDIHVVKIDCVKVDGKLAGLS
ncbi:RNA ligase [Rhodotorula sp. JG-1b]|nr:RNA ligase [Rhodotorula sp. JG-1b]